MCIITYRRRLYISAIDKRNHLKIYAFGVVGETHAHDSFELIWFDNSKDRTFSDKSLCTCDVKMFNCISNKLKLNISKTKQENEKLQKMLLCHFMCSFK